MVTPFVVVIGSVFRDLIYDRPLDDDDATPVQQFDGGIGRNIAETLARLDVRTRLVTLLTPNQTGRRIEAELLSAGVAVAAKWVTPGIGTYQAFFRDGDLEDCRIEQPLLDELDWAFVSAHLDSATHVVVETGIGRSLITGVLDECHGRAVPVYGVPTRLCEIGIADHLDTISRLHCVVMNQSEAETLLSGSLNDTTAALRSVAGLRRTGVRQAIITLGARGVAAAAFGSRAALYPCRATDAISTLGCGDAFTAGFVAASALGHAFAAAIDVGLELARRTAETTGPGCPSANGGLLPSTASRRHSSRGGVAESELGHAF